MPHREAKERTTPAGEKAGQEALPRRMRWTTMAGPVPAAEWRSPATVAEDAHPSRRRNPCKPMRSPAAAPTGRGSLGGCLPRYDQIGTATECRSRSNPALATSFRSSSSCRREADPAVARRTWAGGRSRRPATKRAFSFEQSTAKRCVPGRPIRPQPGRGQVEAHRRDQAVYPALHEHAALKAEGDDRLTGSATSSETKVRKILDTTDRDGIPCGPESQSSGQS